MRAKKEPSEVELREARREKRMEAGMEWFEEYAMEELYGPSGCEPHEEIEALKRLVFFLLRERGIE